MQRHLPVRVVLFLAASFALVGYTPSVFAQAQLSIASVTPSSNTVAAGSVYTYTIAYDCSSITGNCEDGQITMVIPPEITYRSSLGNNQTQSLTGSYNNSNRTVTFDFISPLASGSVGELVIEVLCPNGVTPNGAQTTVIANSTVSNGNPDSGSVTITGTASNTWTTLKRRVTDPPVIDQPITYEVGFTSPGGTGQLNLQNAQIIDTLPTDAQFISADSGCTYDGNTHQVTCVWTSDLDVKTSGTKTHVKKIRVQYNTGDFNIGDSVTNIADGTGTPLGESNTSTGQGTVTHALEAFVPDPRISLKKQITYTNLLIGSEQNYKLTVKNTGNVDLDDFMFTDNIPEALKVTRIQTGKYNNSPINGVISYQTTANANWTQWTTFDGSSNAELQVSALGLGANEMITALKWEYGTVPPNFTHSGNQPRIFAEVLATDRSNNPVNIDDRPENCAALTGTYNGNNSNTSKCVKFTVSEVEGRPEPKKVVTSSGPYVGGSTVSFKVSIRNANQFTTTGPLPNPIGMDLLPTELTYVDNSWSVCAKPAGAPDPHFEKIDDYNSTGRTLLRWSYDGAHGNAYSLPINEQVDICFDTVLPNNAIFGDITNQFHVTTNTDDILGCRGGNGAQDDTNDLDGDSVTGSSDKLCRVSKDFEVEAIATLESTKFVLGTLDANYNRFPDRGQTVEGGLSDYRLTVTNTGTVPVKEIIIYDILPYIGDEGVRTGEARLSEWRPNLVGPVTVSNPGITVYYSTQQNPCRTEVASRPNCVDDWSTTTPQDITSVQALKFELGNIVINPLEDFVLEWPMRAPVGSPTNGEVAWNSFAFTATRLDNNRQLPAAEPIKVGIEVYAPQPSILGDRIWYDFDMDGIQDPDEPGFNGVKVELYRDNGDNVLDPNTDTRPNFNFSGDDQNGNPGYYLFPNIDPDDYFVQFTQPPGYVFSDQNQGNSSLQDSDVDPNTGTTPEITVAPASEDRTWDAGVYHPNRAALGNFVWFDVDRDGVQDNSEQGVAGALAKLYKSDGTFVDSVRTNSLGYYAFVDLEPGTYYVEFGDFPNNYVLGRANQGSDDEADSDADPRTGRTGNYTLAAGEWNRSVDAGLIPESTLGDYVWADDNRDGIQDDAESGVQGVTVKLYNVDDDTLLRTTTTDANGAYLFDRLIEGNYYVVFEAPNNRYLTLPNEGFDDAKDSDADMNSGRTGNYTLGQVQHIPTVDAGLLPIGELPPADLSLTKVVDNPAPPPGDEVTFTIVIKNSGPWEATNVAVRDTIPDGLDITNVTTSQGSYDNNTGIWTVGTLDVNETDTLYITVEANTTDAKENFAEVSASDNPDPDSDPDNGPNNEDDEDTATVSAGSSSGGGGAGVESDGNMATKLATRLFHRRVDAQAREALWTPLIPEPLTVATQAHTAASKSGDAVFDLTQIVPLQGPGESQPFTTTPTDILFVTNAASVYAVDYLRPEGRRMGALFATVSPSNDLYDHAKSTCDRLGGGRMEDVRFLEVDGQRFVMTKLIHPTGEIDYAVSFVAYKHGDGFTIDSQFSPTQYQIPAGLDEIVNMQVWSVAPSFTEQLLRDMLDRFRQQGTVTFANNPTELPPVFMHSGDYEQGTLTLRFVNRSGEATSIDITGTTATTESNAAENNRVDFTQTITIPKPTNGFLVEVEVPVGLMYDATFTLEHRASETADRIYAADGPWGVAVGQNGAVTSFQTFVEERPASDTEYLVERNAFVSGSVTNWVSLFRFLKPNGQAVDMRQYEYLTFTAYGQGRVQLVAEKASIEDGNHFRYNFTLTPQAQTYTVRYEDFAQATGGGTFQPNDLTTLVFYALGNGRNASAFDLVIEDVRFGGMGSVVSNEDAEDVLPQGFTLGQSYPNPFNPQTTIPFALPKAAEVTLTVFDLLGREVEVLVNGQLPAGTYTATFEAGDLSSGTYIYRLTTPQQTITKSMVLLK